MKRTYLNTEIAKNANKELQTPGMLDDETRIDEIKAMPGKKLVYYYTLVNYAIDDLNIDFFEESMKEDLFNNLKNPELKPLKDNEVTFVHIYRDKDGEVISTLEFTYEDYK
jgi:hypothetical protein